MTSVEILAASVRPLTEVLVDRVRAGHSLAWLHDAGKEDADNKSQPDLPLLQDDKEADKPDAIDPTRPDQIAAAWLLGRALDRHRDVLARLRDPDLVAIVEVPSTELLQPIAQVLRNHGLGHEAPVLEGNSLSTTGRRVADPGTVAIFKGVDTDKRRKSSDDTGCLSDFAAAMQRRCAVIGISAEPERLLPRELVDLAEHRIVIAPLDGETIAAVIEAVTGRHPGPIDNDLVHGVTLETLAIAVRADLGAARSLARLRRLLDRNKGKDQGLKLSEMHGLGAAREWALTLIQDLQDYAAGRLSWSAVDRGCLLTGAPGTGKTTLARVMADEAGVFFLATSYAQWQAHREGHLGHVTQAIRKAFAEAQQNAPSVLFIDEIDTIPARGSARGNDDWWTAIVNALLECLDGFERREGVVVIAACNDPRRLDPALIRAGRLDRHIEIPLPDVPALIGILRSHLGNDLQGADLRAAALAARGRTGADVERFVREARGRARREGRDLTLALLLEAIRGGTPEMPLLLRRRVAYHEAGHAIASLALDLAEPVALSIEGSGGLTQTEPGEMRAQTRDHLELYLVVLLAGRAAEEIVFGEATAGTGGDENSDLALATSLALRMETSYALGHSGLLWMPLESSRDLILRPDLHKAVRETLDKSLTRAKQVILANRASLDALAEALTANGYLDQAEITAILTSVPLSTTHMIETPCVEAPLAQTMPGDGGRPAIVGDDLSSGTVPDAVTAGSAQA